MSEFFRKSAEHRFIAHIGEPFYRGRLRLFRSNPQWHRPIDGQGGCGEGVLFPKFRLSGRFRPKDHLGLDGLNKRRFALLQPEICFLFFLALHVAKNELIEPIEPFWKGNLEKFAVFSAAVVENGEITYSEIQQKHFSEKSEKVTDRKKPATRAGRFSEKSAEVSQFV